MFPAIAARLNEQGHRTRRDRPWTRPRDGGSRVVSYDKWGVLLSPVDQGPAGPERGGDFTENDRLW